MKIGRLYLIILAFILSLGLIMPAGANAQSGPNDLNPTNVVDYVLCSMNLGCPSDNTTAAPNTATGAGSNTNANNTYVSSQTANSGSSGGFFSSLFGTGRSNNPSSIVYGATIVRDYTKNEITLVRVPRFDSIPGELRPDEAVYEIIRGKKHLIPNLDIFFDYGFDPRQVQFISQSQLDKYDRVSLVKMEGDKTKAVYYITESGLIRRILNESVLKSYGERAEDIIVISRKEFNYYPENKYVYLDQPFTPDIYLISGDIKRYLTPMAAVRLGILRSQVVPVNATEFNAYKTGEPVLY